MDLSTMKRKLAENQYRSAQAFVDDIHLICRNAMTFNGENSMLGFIAADRKKWIDERYSEKPISQEDEWQKRLESVVARLHEHIARAPPPIMPPATPHSESGK
jgi:bromodomain-containing factor 1